MVFGRGKKQKPQARTTDKPTIPIETVLGPNTNMEGDIRSSGGVQVDGDFQGTIEIAGNLVIGEAAKVVATISANIVQILGTVQGNITAKRIEILETGKLWGDMIVDSFVLDDGGFYRGQSKMQSETQPPLLESSRSQPVSPGAIVDVEAKVKD